MTDQQSFKRSRMLSVPARLGLALALLTAALSVRPVPMAQAAGTITVNTTLDQFNTGSECSLREAIESANTDTDFGGCTRAGTPPYTINLPSGTYTLNLDSWPGSEDANEEDDLDVGASMNIAATGAGVPIIDGFNNDTVFHMNPGGGGDVSVTISGVTIRNGNATGSGGGIFNDGSTLSINNCTLSGNRANSFTAASGGGIYNAAGVVNITDSTLSENQARGNLAGSVARGGGIYSSGGTVAITNSLIYSNTATAVGLGSQFDGGGIYSAGGTVRVTADSDLYENRANCGGGIYQGGGTVFVADSELYGNQAASGGGAIYRSSGVVNITDGSYLAGNQAANYAGGIFSGGGTVNISHSYLFGNKVTATLSNGGGIYNLGGIVNITSSFVSVNQAADHGGGIFNVGGTVNVTSAILSANEATGGTGNEGLGGGIYNYDGAVNITQSNLWENQAVGGGGGIYNYLGVATTTIVDSSLYGNQAVTTTATYYPTGGGIYNSGTVSITGSTVYSNTADKGGGGVRNDGGTVSIANSTFSKNQSSDGSGGGISNVLDGQMTIVNSTISDNQVIDGEGGGIFIATGGTLTVTNSTLSGNQASQHGGGIRNKSTLNLINVTITGNSADQPTDGFGDGGGISNFSGSTVILKNSIVAGNSDASPDPADQHPDCDGTLTISHENLVQDTTGCTLGGSGATITGISPLLGPLADNGGDTQTHALLAGSPAIDKVTDCADFAGNPLITDQRGAARVDGDCDGIVACDLGAFEFQRFDIYLPLVQR